MLYLSQQEKQAIVDSIRLDFANKVRRYDSRKYPENVYERLRIIFRTPQAVTREDIRDALVWKYGHWHKKGYPSSHKHIISKVQNEWSEFLRRQDWDAQQAFNHWMDRLKNHQCFITVSFLVHLLWRDQIPIIDQHNYRAMNSLLKGIRPNWNVRKKPSRFGDLLDLGEFMKDIQDHWSVCGYPAPPDMRSIDKYLMVSGQDLKRSGHK
jgi:hypothetical protein